MCNSFSRGMCTVGGAESIVDIDITKSGQTLCKFRIVCFLFCIEADILKQQYITLIQSGDLSGDFTANNILGKHHGFTQKFRKAFGNGGHGEFRVLLSLGSSEMAHHHHRGALLEQIVDRRKSCLDTGIICYHSILQRHIEIYTYQGFLVGEITLPNSIKNHRFPLLIGRIKSFLQP